jgi:hypothetical protein
MMITTSLAQGSIISSVIKCGFFFNFAILYATNYEASTGAVSFW